MKTIYYSEVLKRQFNTEEECLAAEKLYQEKVLAKQEAENKLKEIQIKINIVSYKIFFNPNFALRLIMF